MQPPQVRRRQEDLRHHPCQGTDHIETSIDTGRELSDIPMERRRGLMQKLHHVGLVERSSDTYHHSIWRVTE